MKRLLRPPDGRSQPEPSYWLAAIDALDTGVRGGPGRNGIDFETLARPIPEA